VFILKFFDLGIWTRDFWRPAHLLDWSVHHPRSIRQFRVRQETGVASREDVRKSDTFVHTGVQIRKLLELMPICYTFHDRRVRQEFLSRLRSHVAVFDDVETRHGQGPGGGDQPGSDNQLCFVPEAGIGLFFFREIAIEQFVKDGGVLHGVVGII
jgi:hypothetical protein